MNNSSIMFSNEKTNHSLGAVSVSADRSLVLDMELLPVFNRCNCVAFYCAISRHKTIHVHVLPDGFPVPIMVLVAIKLS